MKTKYIIVKQGSFELPFVFSELCTHSDIAHQVGGTVVGAGFCIVADDRYCCYGESISCKVKSRYHEDDAVLNKMLLGFDE
jgi:hypothetical protein